MLTTDVAALLEFMDSAEHSLFRLEAQDTYEGAPSDGSDYQRYVRGEPGPDPERKAGWHAACRARIGRGVRLSRVRAVRHPVSDYFRYAAEWGYAHNQPYEDIRVVDTRDNPMAASLLEVGDFWLADNRAAALMSYEPGGAFAGWQLADARDLPLYVAIRDIAFLTGEPFSEYWNANPQLWREHRQAAA